jgi:hypothetical protein
MSMHLVCFSSAVYTASVPVTLLGNVPGWPCSSVVRLYSAAAGLLSESHQIDQVIVEHGVEGLAEVDAVSTQFATEKLNFCYLNFAILRRAQALPPQHTNYLNLQLHGGVVLLGIGNMNLFLTTRCACKA